MQTFLPDESFETTARYLDRSRLAGQRKEAVQLVNAIDPTVLVGIPETIERRRLQLERGEPFKQGWRNHAAAVMWRGRVPALLHYLYHIDREWMRRGYKSNLIIPEAGPVVMPSWMGDERLHSSHRSALLRKLPGHYETFGWSDDPAAEYFWPGQCMNLEKVDGQEAGSGPVAA